MLNLTAEAKQAWLAQTRQVNARVTIGTAVYNADKIMSIDYDSGSISGETFQIGSFYQNSIKVVLVGILESLANDNKVKLEFAVKVGQAFEWVNMGTFYVTELDRDRNSNRTTFTAVDASVYLGKNYAPTISFPNSLKNLVTDISNQCGVQVNFASMAHLADVNVTQPPSKYTCRQVISMVAQIHGGFARINRNDQLEVTRLMSSDIELSPSHYLLKGLTKNETTYRTDGIIVKIGENEEDVLKVGTTTGSAVINLENPLMTQTLLDEMWRVVSIISYYPFNLKWRGIPNLEAGDWITIVDKQGTRYRVPNLSYKLSFKGGLSAESSANTTATSNVQHKLRGTLTQRVEDVEGYVNATGGRSYTGLDVPDNKYLKKGDTWYKPDGDDTAILVYDGEKWEEVASPEVFRQLQADFDALDKQAKEAFEQVDTLVQESPETKRLAQEAQEAVNLANQEITKLQTSVSDTKTALENAEQELNDRVDTVTTTISENYATKTELADVSVSVDKKITESATTLKTEMSETYAVKSDLTTLQGDYDSFKEQTAQKISQQVSSIQTIQTDTTNAKQLANDALNKANSAVTSASNASSTASSALSKASDASSVANSASQNATNAVASANSAVSTANTAKSNADKAIADVASLTQTVTTQSTRIDQTSSRIEQVASGVTEVGDRLDNNADGINLFAVTNSISGYRVVPYDIRPDKAIYPCFEDATHIISELIPCSEGDVFTFSTTYESATSAIGFFDENKVCFNRPIGYNAGVTPSTPVTCTAPKGSKYIAVSCEKPRIGKMKLERGKTATPFTKAIADQQTDIVDINNNIINNYYQKTTVDSKISTAVSGITAQYTKDISTQLNNYYDKATMDRRLTIGDVGIETYVKNTQSQLNDLNVIGTNLNVVSESVEGYRVVDGLTSGNSVYPCYPDSQHIVSELIPCSPGDVFTISTTYKSTDTTNVYISIGFFDETKFCFNRFNGQRSGVDKDAPKTVVAPARSKYIAVSYHKLHNNAVKIEKGNSYTGWSANPKDLTNLTQYTQVKQQADQLSATVYDSASGLVTKTTQLAGKYAIQNLNSYGDVLSSLNLNGGNVRIKGGLIDLDGNVRIQDAFVTNLKANSILANEITAKATTVVNAKIANLDAGVITTGILKGTNLSLNLGTGEVQFQKGRIQAPNNTLDIQVNTGIMKVLNTNGEGVTFQNGNLYFSNATTQGYYGSFSYDNNTYSWSNGGILINGKKAFSLYLSEKTDEFFYQPNSNYDIEKNIQISGIKSNEDYLLNIIAHDKITLMAGKRLTYKEGYLNLYEYPHITIGDRSGLATANGLSMAGQIVKIKGTQQMQIESPSVLFTGDECLVFGNLIVYGTINGKKM